MNKTPFIILGALAVLAGFLVFSYKHSEKEPGGNTPSSVAAYRATLSGEYLCLPHTVTSGPQTLECALGLKTDDGKYYALDFNLSSQMPPPFATGDRLEASGVVTPVAMLNTDNWQKYPIVGIFSVTDSVRKLNNGPLPYMCNSDAKICPDGSSVGRTGSECQFAACPSPDAASALIHTTLGQKATGLAVSITPKEIVSDSRCPADVQCVWAGTVEVRAVTETKVAHGEQTFKLNEPKVFGDFSITLVEVSPDRKNGQEIPDSSYRFVFEVKKQ